jgi:transposase
MSLQRLLVALPSGSRKRPTPILPGIVVTLASATPRHGARPQAVIADGGSVPVAPPRPPARAATLAAERRQRRMARYQQVWRLRREGWPGHAIARQLGLGRSTVARYLRHETFPERKGRSDVGRSLLDPWKPLLLKRWNAGQRDGRRLFRELQGRGYRGAATPPWRATPNACGRRRSARRCGRRSPPGAPLSPRSSTGPSGR